MNMDDMPQWDKGIDVLAGPYASMDQAYEQANELNPEGSSSSSRPKAHKASDGKYYVIRDTNPIPDDLGLF
jgi:hypothetical protein